MNGDPNAARHIADLDDRLAGHLGALRERAEQARQAVADGTSDLAARLNPPEPEPLPPPESHPATGHVSLEDDPFLPEAGDDGIPLWDDPATT